MVIQILQTTDFDGNSYAVDLSGDSEFFSFDEESQELRFNSKEAK